MRWLYYSDHVLSVDYSDNGGSHGAGEGMVLGLMATMEADFQGVFDNYARNVDNNPSEALTNLARLPSTFQGVEPMGGLVVLFLSVCLLCCCVVSGVVVVLKCWDFFRFKKKKF